MKILQLLRDNARREKRPVNVAREGDTASIYIYDVISADWGVGAMQVLSALRDAAGASTLRVHINSPGGDVFEGRAIMAALRSFEGKTTACIDSLCASAATSIALACNEVEMCDGAFFMIHEAMGICFGSKRDMRETADTIEKVEGAIVADYVAKTGKKPEEVLAWMEAETWFSAEEALQHGFVDRMMKPDDMPKMSARPPMEDRWNLAAFDKAPAALTAPRAAEPQPEPAGQFMSASNRNRMRLLEIA